MSNGTAFLSLNRTPSSNSGPNPSFGASQGSKGRLAAIDSVGSSGYLGSRGSGKTGGDWEEEEDDRVLRFGDSIVVSDMDSKGLILGCSEGSGVVLDQIEGSATQDYPDVQLAAFNITHKFQYAASKDMDKRLRQRHGLNRDNWTDKVGVSDPLHSELSASLQLIHDEKATNHSEMRRKAGDAVTYGAVVQLWHLGNKKCLTQRKNRALRNKLAMEVCLLEDGGEGSWWQVLPAEKIRAIGDPVKNGDRVSFENFKYTKSHLCLSSPYDTLYDGSMPPHPCVSQRLEVNAYAWPTIFRLRMFRSLEHCKFMSSITEQNSIANIDTVVTGIACVTLTHRHHDSLLLGDTESGTVSWMPRNEAKGSPEEGEEASVEPSSMWRVVLRDVSNGGEAIPRVSPSLVLEHVASGLYLTQSAAGTVSLTPYPSDADCHWSLQSRPLSASSKGEGGGEFIQDGGMVWLKSLAATTSSESVWLSHGTPLASGCGSRCQRTAANPAAARSGKRENQDALQINVVEGAVTNTVDYMRRCRSFLSAICADLVSDGAIEGAPEDDDEAATLAVQSHPSIKRLRDYLATYDDMMCMLIRGCTIDDEAEVLARRGAPVERHQALLSKCGVIEGSMRLIKCIYNDVKVPLRLVEKRLPVVFRVTRLAYLLIERACLHNRDCKVTMLPHYTTIQSHVGGMVGAFYTMLVIFSGTRELVEKVDNERLSGWREMLPRMRNCKVMSFLVEICVCNGEPLKANQDRVVNILVEDHQHVALQTRIVGDDLFLVDPRAPDDAPVSCADVRKQFGEDVMQPNNLDHADRSLKLYQVFLMILELFHSISKGRNTSAIQQLLAVSPKYGVSFENLSAIVKSPLLPYELRSRAINVITGLYIDVEPHQPLEMIHKTRVWTHLLSGEVANAIGEVSHGRSSQEDLVRAHEMKDLKAILLDLLKESAYVDADEPERNNSVIKVIDCLTSLVQFGFYHKFDQRHRAPVLDFEQVKPLSEALVAYIDGRTDVNSASHHKNNMSSSYSSLNRSQGPRLSPKGPSSKGSFDGASRNNTDESERRESRLIHSEKNMVVMIGKNRAMKLLSSFFRAATNRRINKIVEFWEHLLEERFGERGCCKEPNVQQQHQNGKVNQNGKANEGKGANGTNVIQKSKSVNGAALINARKLSDVRLAIAGKEVAGDAHQVATCDPHFLVLKGGVRVPKGVFPNGLLEYFANIRKWETDPPWTTGELKALTQDLFHGESVLSDMFGLDGLNSMFEKGNEWLIPDWIKIVLDTVRYDCPYMKEQGLFILIASFNQQSNFLQLLESINFIYCPSTARRFFVMRSDLLQLRSCIGPLQSHIEEEKRAACLKTSEILDRWTGFITLSAKDGWSDYDVSEMQRVACSLGVCDVVYKIIGVPMQRIPAIMFGELDRAQDECLRWVFEKAFAFLSAMCWRNHGMQMHVLEHEGVVTSLLGLEGIDAEGLLGSAVRDNLEAVSKVGKKWIYKLFWDVIGKYGRKRAHVMDAMVFMMKCGDKALKDNQATVMSMFKKHDKILGSFMLSDEDWNKRIELMRQDEHITGGAGSELAFHLSAVRLLYTASEGKNPAAEVYAANYMTFEQVLNTLLTLDISPTTDEKATDISRTTLCTVRSAFVRLLLHVYVDTRVERLLQEQRELGNGMWSWAHTWDDKCKTRPYMFVLLKELRDFAARSAESAWGEISNEEKEYFYGAVMGFLTFYYRDSYPVVKGQTEADEKVSLDIFETCERLIKNPHNGQIGDDECVSITTPDEGTINCIARVWGLLKAMSVDSGVKPRWYEQQGECEHRCKVRIDKNAVRISLSHATELIISALAEEWGVSQSAGLVGHGHRQLACMLSRKGEVPLFDSKHLTSGNVATIAGRHRPTYDDFVQAILRVSLRSSTAIPVLRDILIIMRIILYIQDPLCPDNSPMECKESWEGFLTHAAIEKYDDADGQVLRWLQAKYASIGCIEAALRLMSHRDPGVQSASLSLLCALLQGGNEKVQDIVVRYFKTSRDGGPFQVFESVLETAMEKLKEFKKALKLLKMADADGEAGATGTDTCEGFGKESVVMLTLRVIQLLVEGQYAPMQDMMRHQPFATTSRNIISKLSSLFEAIQPLILDAMRFNDGSLVILAMQVCDTLQELVQGPNRENQAALVSSSFFASVNRMLSSVAYSDLPIDQATVPGLDASTNDLKCFLKGSLLSCCLSVLEGSVEPVLPRRMLGFFELRNIEAQIIQCGALLGFCSQAMEHQCRSRAQFKGRQKLYDVLTTRALGKRFAPGWQDAILGEMLSYYILLLNFREWDPAGRVSDSIGNMARSNPRLSAFLERHVLDVEIVRQSQDFGAGSIVERVFFPVEPAVVDLTHTRDFRTKTSEFMCDVPRANPHEKARAFLRKLVMIGRSVQWMTINLRSPIRAFVIRRRDVLDVVPLWIAMVITLCILLFYGVPVDPNTGQVLAHGKFYSEDEIPGYVDAVYPFANETSDPTGIGMMYSTIHAQSDLSLKFRLKMVTRWESVDEWRLWPAGKYLLWVLAGLHVLMTLVNACIYLTQDLPLVIFETYDRQRQRQQQSLTTVSENEDEDGFEREKRENQNGKEAPDKMHTVFTVTVIKELLRDTRYACYLAFMLILSVLGFVSSPFFFVFSLIDYFRLPDGMLVLQAVITGGPNLARSFILGMLVIVCFGFYSYSYFSLTINEQQMVCHTPLQCVSKHILDAVTGDLSTVLGDDFGDFAFPAMVLWEDSWEAWRTSFVFASLIFWVFLLQSIIQGQIIDAFAEMRSRRTAALKDLEDKCFVSSIDRFVFNAYPGEWEKRRGGQYAWHYILYTTYLFGKSREEYTGLENAVSEAYSTGNISFLPIERLVSKQREDTSEGGGVVEGGSGGDVNVGGGGHHAAQLREEVTKMRNEMLSLSRTTSKVLQSVVQRRDSSEHGVLSSPQSLVYPQPSSGTNLGLLGSSTRRMTPQALEPASSIMMGLGSQGLMPSSAGLIDASPTLLAHRPTTPEGAYASHDEGDEDGNEEGEDRLGRGAGSDDDGEVVEEVVGGGQA